MSILRSIIKKLLIEHLYKKYVDENVIVKADISRTIETRGCKVNREDFKKMFAHLMQYYPDFAFIFFWRINQRSHRIKNYFTRDYECKIFKNTEIEGGLMCFHPFASVINAKKIGKNFQFRNSLTIGNKYNDNSLLPTIGNNVIVGSNCVIIGDINIGDNVVIGAGSVVVKDIPSNVIVAGNPAKIIRRLTDD